MSAMPPQVHRTLLCVVAALLLLAAATALEPSAVTVNGVTPKTFGGTQCVSIIDGCDTCLRYLFPRNASVTLGTGAKPANGGEFWRVHVCQVCQPGWTLYGSGDFHNFKKFPKYCIPNKVKCPPSPDNSSAPNSDGFTNCGTRVGSLCKAECSAGYTGGYSALCTRSPKGDSAYWVVTGECKPVKPPPGKRCPATPRVNPPPNAKPYKNCKRGVGSVCKATCDTANGASGVGYTARCKLVKGKATWVVTGKCSPPATTCPATPPQQSNAGPFQNCQPKVGSTCSAACNTNFTGGYNATCSADGTWAVTGACTATSPPTCQVTAQSPAPQSNAGPFENCKDSVGSACSATCNTNFTGGYNATCTLSANGTMAYWTITGNCTLSGTNLTCPATPPQQSNAGPFENCKDSVGSACSATCNTNFTGGYNATCTANGTAADWVVTGACTPAGGLVVNTCVGFCGVRGLRDQATNQPCFCDYWCNLYDDCCGGMNATAAANKDAACPNFSPSADLNRLYTCSNQVGVLTDVNKCKTYRPAGCWCDSFCNTAGDCCNDCPASCGGGTCTATPPPVQVQSTGGSIPLQCGAQDLVSAIGAYRKKIAGGAVPAAFTPELEGRVQACQNAITQMDMLTPVTTIDVYMANTRVNGVASTYDETRGRALLDEVNKVYSRSGFRFQLKLFSTTVFEFPTLDALDGPLNVCSDLAQPPPDNNPNCVRCVAYQNLIPAAERSSRVAAVWLVNRDILTAIGGAAYLPQNSYSPNTNSNGDRFSCLDGLWSMATPNTTNVLDDASVLHHELGHWMGLSHTWNGNTDATLDATGLCQQQAFQFYRKPDFLFASFTDGVRDTPPQLPANVNGNRSALLFDCDANFVFTPTPAAPLLSCDGLPPTNGKYINNVYNIMSYFANRCSVQRKTFSADQVARMRCVWRCYRLNECGTGTFPYTDPFGSGNGGSGGGSV